MNATEGIRVGHAQQQRLHSMLHTDTIVKTPNIVLKAGGCHAECKAKHEAR